MAAVVALALSGVLLLAMAGLFVGIIDGVTATINRSPADIMVMDPKSESLLSSGPLPARVKPQIYMNSDVAKVQELGGNGGQFANIPKPGDKRKNTNVQVMGVDPYPGSATLPTDLPPEAVAAIQQPFAVAVDKTALKSLGVKKGDLATLNGKTIRIAAVLENYPSVMQTMVITSDSTIRLLGLRRSSTMTGPLMVRLKNPATAPQVRDQLNALSSGKYKAWLRSDLAKANQKSMLLESFLGILLGFVAFMSALIGIGITSQTLRGAILANIKEFASLRALGVSMGSLRMIVLELSFWVGVVGIGAAILLAYVLAFAAHARGLPMSYPLWLTGATSVLLLVIALMSGLFALGMLQKSQPADLLR
jgi:putative ABC transport system permease protein